MIVPAGNRREQVSQTMQDQVFTNESNRVWEGFIKKIAANKQAIVNMSPVDLQTNPEVTNAVGMPNTSVGMPDTSLQQTMNDTNNSAMRGALNTGGAQQIDVLKFTTEVAEMVQQKYPGVKLQAYKDAGGSIQLTFQLPVAGQEPIVTK